ncbi:MAG TPA: APC family permease [Gemmataceae bacterium]|nr:APC family permease [Gemmataceae bacterium]
MGDNDTGGLRRHFGLLQAVALNVTMIVGAGVFVTIPLMLGKLPGPYALLGWLGGGALILLDGLVWSELGATLPGSGGSYLYLLECYGRRRWGRLAAFLFIWQFLLSGPLEIASGLIAMAQFSTALSRGFALFNEAHTRKVELLAGTGLFVSFSPARMGAVLAGVLILFLLYRRVTTLGRLTVAFWLGVLAVIAWVLVEGGLRFDPAVAFAPPAASPAAGGLAYNLGGVMLLALYSYFGYYQICYVGDEVRDPGRTIPRAVVGSAALVCVLFLALHLAMLGTVPWREVPLGDDNYSLTADFMRRIHGDWAASVVTVLLMGSCFVSVFAGLLGYSRIPYGAARYGHFFAPLGRVHPVHHIPHVALLLVGGLTLLWTFFDLQSVIEALIVTRILEQFVAQIVGVMLLRRREPDRARPYRMALYPLPCLLALAGWLYLYATANPWYILLGLATLTAGAVAFVLWSWTTRRWPFAAAGTGLEEKPAAG